MNVPEPNSIQVKREATDLSDSFLDTHSWGGGVAEGVDSADVWVILTESPGWEKVPKGACKENGKITKAVGANKHKTLKQYPLVWNTLIS